MAASGSSALVKRKADMALMPPPPPPLTKRQKRPKNVLDEDAYHEAVSQIVARDFFPGLLETEAQQDYMAALDSHDSGWIRDAGRRLTQVMTPVPDGRRRMGRGTSFTPRAATSIGDTPRSYAGSTPARTPHTIDGHDFDSHAASEVDINMSLGAFQAKYTSEDNESFNALLDSQNEKRAAKYNFFRNGNKIPTSRHIAYRERAQGLIEQGQTSAALVVRNAAGEERTALAVARPSEDLDARPASVESFPDRQGPRNHFMFGPDGVDESTLTYAQAAEQRSNAPPKSVTHSATRFHAELPPDGHVAPSPSLSAIDAAIAGRPRATASETGYTGAETPRVNGYAFVDAEPTPSELGLPVDDDEADAAEREAAIKLLPKVDSDGPNPFSIKEGSKREGIHRRLVERADAARRKEKGDGNQLDRLRSLGITPGGRTPTPRFSSTPRPAAAGSKTAMTPAAQRLAAKIGTPRRDDAILQSSSVKIGQAGWTPTPRGSRRPA